MYKEKIKQRIKDLRIAFIVNFAVRLFQTIFVGIEIALTLSHVINIPIISEHTAEIVVLVITKLMIPILCLNELCKKTRLTLDNKIGLFPT